MDPATLVAIFALVGSLITGIVTLIGKRGSDKVSDDANLRDDQRLFITELRQEIIDNRNERDALRDRVHELDKRVETLTQRLNLRDQENAELIAENRNLRARIGDTP